jgi:hypothetical protein
MKPIGKDFDFIVDTFSGGGMMEFIALKVLLAQVEIQADKGDKGSKEVLKIVRNFAGLIRFARDNASWEKV